MKDLKINTEERKIKMVDGRTPVILNNRHLFLYEEWFIILEQSDKENDSLFAEQILNSIAKYKYPLRFK